MVKKILAQTYLWILLLLLYSPIVIIVIYSFTEAKFWETGPDFQQNSTLLCLQPEPIIR